MEKSRLRQEEGLFVIEGVRELHVALTCGFTMHTLFLCPHIFTDTGKADHFKKHAPLTQELDEDVYRKTAYRGTTEGVLAIMHAKHLTPEQVRLPENPLVLVLEAVEKPGNLGAVLRTADACGINAVVVCDPRTDLYNPNTVRASLGSLFSVPVLACSSQEAYDWLVSHKMQIVAATSRAATPYHTCLYHTPTAFVLGSEEKGLGVFWKEKAHCRVKIPMKGIIDSLNVSVSAAVLCFEAVRQRNALKNDAL